MEILVTGAAGFIGSNTVRALAEAGHSVAGVDDLKSGFDPQLQQHRLKGLQKVRGFRFRRADLARPGALKRAFPRNSFDAILHLAARTGVRPSLDAMAPYYRSNVLSTLQVLEHARRHDVRRVVYASSSSVYGEGAAVPFREDALLGTPVSPYAASKLSGEHLAILYRGNHGIQAPVLRFFTVYGPAGRPDMSILRFIHKIARGQPVPVYGTGRQARDFTYIDDIVRGILAAMHGPPELVCNLGSDAPVTVNHLVRLLEKTIGRRARIEHRPRPPGEMERTWADIGRARRHLKWAPRVSLREGLARTVRWYRGVPTLAARLRFE